MDSYDVLLKYRIITEVDGCVRIAFLDEQMEGINSKRQQASIAGKMSAAARKRSTESNDRSTTVQRNPTEKSRVEKMREDEDKETKVSPEKGNGTLSLKERIAKANEMVVPYLNEMAGSAFRSDTKSTKRIIGARVKEGYGWKDFQAVIDSKVEAWGKDPKMCEFIRPSTLFGTKFEEYLNASRRASAEKPKQPKFNYNSPIL
jgi:uncharacterized phage protein (TIGR02220 family)